MRTESPSPVFARVRVGALDAARPDRRAVTVFVARKTGCGEETTISPGSLAHEANGSTHNKRQYQPLGSNRQYTCKISSGSMVPCCEFELSTHHQFYRSASLQTPAIVANEWSSASIAPSSSISALQYELPRAQPRNPSPSLSQGRSRSKWRKLFDFSTTEKHATNFFEKIITN